MPLSNWAARAFQKTVTNVFYSRGLPTRRRRSRRPAQQISLESLEPRQMLSVNDVTLTLASGVLTATNYADATYTINSFSYNSSTNKVSFELTGAAVITEALAAVTITGTEGTQTVTIDMADASVATTFAGLKLTSTATKFLDAHIGLAGIDLSAVATGAANQGFGISGLDSTVDNDTTVLGAIKAKGTGDITLNIGTNPTSYLDIITLGDITATTGSVNITAGVINSNGDVTSAGPFNLAGTGDLSVGGVISVACVNALSTTGDVSFGETVNTTGAEGFISEATLATKATRIARAITVGAGAQALVTGNLIANNSTLAAFTTSGVGNITITGDVNPSVAGNKLTLVAGSGAITIGGTVGSSPVAFGDLIADGTSIFLASGTVNVGGNLRVGQTTAFATSVTFADVLFLLLKLSQ